MSDIFKDRELELALEDLARSISMARIASIDRDPNTYIKLVERMGAMSTLLVRKLATRPKKQEIVDRPCVSANNNTHENLLSMQQKETPGEISEGQTKK